MPVYRRNYEGEYFFFTVVTCGRNDLFDNPMNRQILSDSIKSTQREYPWQMTAMILLPNHFHMIWQLPQDDTNYSRRIAMIKLRFTKQYFQHGGKEFHISPSQQKQRYRGIWQRKFWEHTIKNEADFKMHLDYIHINPVKHGLTEKPSEWQWSSFHRYVKMGWYESDWNGRVDLPGSVEYFWNE